MIQAEETKQRKAAYHREWVAKNREHMRAYAKARTATESAEAKEKKRIYMQAYHAAHKEKAREAGKAWRAANIEKRRAQNSAWKKANPDKVKAGSRRYYAKNKHAIIERTRPVWEKANRERPAQILARQETVLGRQRPEVCDICGDKDWRIVFDHCHAKGHARGWLCDGCNKGLGSFRDDPERLIKAAAYLKRAAHIVSPQLSIPGI